MSITLKEETLKEELAKWLAALEGIPNEDQPWMKQLISLFRRKTISISEDNKGKRLVGEFIENLRRIIPSIETDANDIRLRKLEQNWGLIKAIKASKNLLENQQENQPTIRSRH